MPRGPRAAYLDANAIIRFIESEDKGLLTLFEQAAASLVQLVTSELTLAEVLVAPLKEGNERLVALYEEFLTSDDVLEVRSVDRGILQRSARIRATFGNKGPDAIHIATALATDCSIFVSSDRRIKLPEQLVQIELDRIDDLDTWS